MNPQLVAVLGCAILGFEVLMLTYIAYVYWVNLPAWGTGLRLAAAADMLMRIASAFLLMGASISLLCRQGAALCWLRAWSAVFILWPPIVSILFFGLGEVPLGLALVLVSFMAAGSTGALAVVLFWPLALASWLALPVSALLWSLRCRRMNPASQSKRGGFAICGCLILISSAHAAGG